VRLQWHANGMLADSLEFDRAGKGVEVRWWDDGALSVAGFWVSDSLKKGRWKHYHRNGTLMATDDYRDGKLISYACFDEAGVPLDAELCPEKEAELDKFEYRRFLERNIKPDGLVKSGLPKGTYTVMIRFMVDRDGSITNVTPLTRFGYGLEEMVADVIKRSPHWIPGRVHGRPVRSYHTQPITLSVQ
jgi:hypothetical protein